MYAVIQSGGKQERVAEGQQLRVELLGVPEGSEVELAPVLVVDDDRVLATPDRAGRDGGGRPGGGRGARARRSGASPTRPRRGAGAAGATASSTPPSRSLSITVPAGR